MTLVTSLMYYRLGEAWTCILLGCFDLVPSPIPFAFLMWGTRLRVKILFCKQLKGIEGKNAEGVEGN